MKRFRRAVQRVFLLIPLFQLLIITPVSNGSTYQLAKQSSIDHYSPYQVERQSGLYYENLDLTEHSLMIVGGVKGNVDIKIWMDWIVAYKGWSEDQWKALLYQWDNATSFAEKNQVLAFQSIRVFSWGGSDSTEARRNAKKVPTRDMVGQLAKEMEGMPNVTLIGWSKGGNLVLHYLNQLAGGKLENGVIPVSVILLAPATHPFLALWNINLVPEEIPPIISKAVSICAVQDNVCTETVVGALNIDPSGYYSDKKYHGPFGLYAQDVIGYMGRNDTVAYK